MQQADVAQLVEQLIRNQQVTGSIPVVGSIIYQLQPICKDGLFHVYTAYAAKMVHETREAPSQSVRQDVFPSGSGKYSHTTANQAIELA